jgi:aldose 1-epimerase
MTQTTKTVAATILMGLLTIKMACAEVKSSIWGQLQDGTAVPIYTLTAKQIEVRVTAYGAHIVSVRVPDRAGKMADVVLGFDSLEGYTTRNPYLGASVGRFANRIALGRFKLDGMTYQVPVENGANALHGGPKGFDKYVWDAHEVPGGVEFVHLSPDGDMGFPGTLTARVRYTVSEAALRIDYSATTDKDTVVNLTNHSYFNLRGDDQGDILADRIQIYANRFTPVDKSLIPTGDLTLVAGTPFDFRKPMAIGARINSDDEQLKFGQGYDMNYALNGRSGKIHKAAVVIDPVSGRKLTVETTEPGLQFYSGNTLHGTVTGRHGIAYKEHSALCLETQHFPDSPNHANFPSTILRPGETMNSTTIYTFGVVL